MKTENNTAVISNIVPRGDSKKKKREKAEAVNKLLIDIWEQKEILLVDPSNISTKRHLSKSKLHLNAHGNLFLLEILEIF